MSAEKYDEGKPPLALVSAPWLFAVADVLGFGARKYSAHNWRSGLALSRCVSAALRHIYQFNAGEDFDPETGKSHLAHASCCLMFAFEILQSDPSWDDRYKGAP